MAPEQPQPPHTWSPIPASYDARLTQQWTAWQESHTLAAERQSWAAAWGAQPLLIGDGDHNDTISSYPHALSFNLSGDFLDGHGYWQHPDLGPPLHVKNTPMVNDPLDSTVVQFARTPVLGRPPVVCCRCPLQSRTDREVERFRLVISARQTYCHHLVSCRHSPRRPRSDAGLNPRLHERAGPSVELRRSGPTILLERCSHLIFRDNTVVDARPGTTAAIGIGHTVALGDDGVRISNLDAQLGPQAASIVDQPAAKQ